MSNENEIVVAQRAMEVAEIESQIATAKRYPRDIRVFKEKLSAMANIDQETAESCYYALPRGDKPIEGPSIRLAEIAIASYQNLVAEADVLLEDDRFVYAMGQCRDLENNVAIRMKVRRRITKADSLICDKCGEWHKMLPKNGKCRKCKNGDVILKKGERYNDDMIAVTANAACAIALRNAVFKIIPLAYIKPVYEQCKKTAVGSAVSLTQRRSEVMSRLKKFGVTDDRILAVIERRSVEEITFDDVAKLIGFGTAIKDGEITVEEAFPLLTFGESQKVSDDSKKAEAGSQKTGDVFADNDKPEPAVNPKIKKQIEELRADEQKEAPKPDEIKPFDWYCAECDHEFDKPKAGACPECGSKKIGKQRGKNVMPGFMKD